MKRIILICLTLLALSIGAFSFFKVFVGNLSPIFSPTPAVVAPTQPNGLSSDQDENQPTKSSKPSLGKPLNFNLDLPNDYQISVFANKIEGVRDLQFTPKGTLLVSSPAQGSVYALPDKNQDGYFDQAKPILQNLNKPHGLAFYQEQLFVVEETRLTRWHWDEQNLKASLDQELFSLPEGERHTTRTIDFRDDGQMFISLGSTCNVCFEDHPWIATVITSNAQGDEPTVFAQGLRNAVFIKVNPDTGNLWGTEMGRDFLGDDTPSDEINIIKSGEHYGWPVCYGNQIYDTDFGQRTLNFCEKTQPPAYNIQAHSAPLGLTFIDSNLFPEDWQGDLLVAYHGSWNRSVPVGYKIVRLRIDNQQVIREEDFLTGFLRDSSAVGRPVDVTFGPSGRLYISDDKAGAIYQIYSR